MIIDEREDDERPHDHISIMNDFKRLFPNIVCGSRGLLLPHDGVLEVVLTRGVICTTTECGKVSFSRV